MSNLYGKVSIIGAGYVGSTIAYTLVTSNLASELVIVDANKEKAIGEEMDLNHGLSFIDPVKITAGDYNDITNSDIVIITAGAAQKLGETRLDLVKKNTEIFKDIIPEITKYAPESIILVVTNPVDILTYVTFKLSGFSKNRVMGSGTVLDTSRFKYLLSKHMEIDSRNVHTYVLGEHGDSEVPIWSKTTIAGMNIKEFCQNCGKCSGQTKYKIFDNVKNAAYQIIEKKGATNYAIALGVKKIVQSILRNEHSILTVSSFVQDKYGFDDVCLSIPSVVSNEGIKDILKVSLSNEEKNKLYKSAKLLKNTINEIDIG